MTILFEAGGFHPDGMPEDLICYRGDGETHVSNFVKESKYKAVFHPGASVYHKVTPERMLFRYFYRRGYSQGISDSYSTLRKSKTPFFNNTIDGYLKLIWRSAKLVKYFDYNIKKALYLQYKGHFDGYFFHQKKYKNSRDVKIWTHKGKYY